MERFVIHEQVPNPERAEVRRHIFRQVRARAGRDSEPVADSELETLVPAYVDAVMGKRTDKLAGIQNQLLDLCLKDPAGTERYAQKFNRLLQQRQRGVIFGPERQRGMVSAVQFVVAEQNRPIAENEEKIIALNDWADAKHKVDFVVLRGTRTDEGVFQALELSLVQTKSNSDDAARDQALIEDAHDTFLHDIAAQRRDILAARMGNERTPQWLKSGEEFITDVVDIFIDTAGKDDPSVLAEVITQQLFRSKDTESARKIYQRNRDLINDSMSGALHLIEGDPGLKDDAHLQALKEAFDIIAHDVPSLDADLYTVPSFTTIITVGGKEFYRKPWVLENEGPVVGINEKY